VHRIERASAAQLDTWIGRLHSATSLDELIADEPIDRLPR
jgi:hypothetical protein